MQGIAQTFVELAGKYYPERLGMLYLVGAPGFFSSLWNMMLPLVDKSTREKLCLLPCASVLLAAASATLVLQCLVLGLECACTASIRLCSASKRLHVCHIH